MMENAFKLEVAGQTKTLSVKVVPIPKVLVDFRPHKGWSGEFGFDWMRIEDTKIDGDVLYEKNVGEYGAIYATKTGAVFTAKKFKDLEKLYNPENINGRKDAAGTLMKYYTPWLSMYREPNAKTAPVAQLELLGDVDHEPDKLYLEFEKEFFDISGAKDSPDDPDLKILDLPAAFMAKTSKGKPNKTNIDLQCISTFSKDQTIKVWSVKNKADGTPDKPMLSGRLKVKANSKSERRVSKIVFINVKTKINSTKKSGISASKKLTQEEYLSPFLKQALVKPEIENEDFELFDSSLKIVQELNKDYTLNRGGTKVFNKNGKIGGDSLVEFLNKKFDANPAFSKYKKYYKVFFLGEKGGRMNGTDYVGLGGHANGIPSNECVMYANPMKFFVAHELMHCMGLYHSFDNNSAHTFKLAQTENIMDYSHVSTYAKPNGTLTQISTWTWQWDILKKSNKKET